MTAFSSLLRAAPHPTPRTGACRCRAALEAQGPLNGGVSNLGGHFGYFFFFFGSGEGKGEYGTTGRGVSVFLLKIPGGGGVLQERGGGQGAGRSAGNLGGGAKYFFFGAEMPTKKRGGFPSVRQIAPA